MSSQINPGEYWACAQPPCQKPSKCQLVGACLQLADQSRIAHGSRVRPKGEPCFTEFVPVGLDATIGDAQPLLDEVQKRGKNTGAVFFHVKFMGAGLGFKVEGWDHKPEDE